MGWKLLFMWAAGILCGLGIMYGVMSTLGRYQRVPPEFQGMEGHWYWMPGPAHPGH